MSETLEHQVEDEAPETGLLHRQFAATVTPGVGRTVDVQVVPYGERIEHNDGLGGVPKGVIYREEFAPGAFDHQLNAANRVLVNCEHERGIAGVVGHGLALVSNPDGLYGSFKIHDTPAGETALTLIREGVFHSVSLEALPRKAVRTADGVIRRTKADLRGVSLARFGAYASAKVLALREQADNVVDEELLPVDLDPELIERCRRLGITLPQRYQAHPADTDTPAAAGTSDDGTRQTEDQADIQETS
jgi:Escherichia/Staphylococcus phage prohead protease